MELILIRHALPVRVRTDGAPADPGLSPHGATQAGAVGDWLAVEEITAVYSSPKRRAIETAEPIAAPHGLEPQIITELAEFDRHEREYIPMEEMRAENHPRLAELADGLTGPVGHAFRTRIVKAVEQIVAVHSGERVVIACHAGVVSAYLSQVMGIDRPLFFEAAYASVSRVLAARSGPRTLKSANETGHLRAVEPG